MGLAWEQMGCGYLRSVCRYVLWLREDEQDSYKEFGVENHHQETRAVTVLLAFFVWKDANESAQ